MCKIVYSSLACMCKVNKHLKSFIFYFFHFCLIKIQENPLVTVTELKRDRLEYSKLVLVIFLLIQPEEIGLKLRGTETICNPNLVCNWCYTEQMHPRCALWVSRRVEKKDVRQQTVCPRRHKHQSTWPGCRLLYRRPLNLINSCRFRLLTTVQDRI